MWGAFRSTGVMLSGLFKKQRFTLTRTQKYRLRQRLKQVDQVIDTLIESKVSFKDLELAKRIPKEHQLSPFEKYYVQSKRYRNGFKPLHWVPHWTKVAHPRKWTPNYRHEPTK